MYVQQYAQSMSEKSEKVEPVLGPFPLDLMRRVQNACATGCTVYVCKVKPILRPSPHGMMRLIQDVCAAYTQSMSEKSDPFWDLSRLI